MTKCNWKIYIVAHNGVHDSMYEDDENFNKDNYTVLNVGKEPFKVSNKYSILHQEQLPNFVSLGKWWAESEGIYNIWKNNLHLEMDFIGFIHYDKELRLTKRKLISSRTDITNRINKYINNRKKGHISLETHKTFNDYNQKIMADESQPNTLVGNGVNCYDYILDDYNNYFNASYTIKDFFNKKYINLCSCFLIDTHTFNKMMKFWDYIVCSKKLEKFDTNHNYRFQGGMAERYFGLFLAFEYNEMLDLSIIHHYNKGLK